MAKQRWIVRATRKLPTGTVVTYWQGPARGWGTTSGPLDEAAEWTTKHAAETALRKVYGRPQVWRAPAVTSPSGTRTPPASNPIIRRKVGNRR